MKILLIILLEILLFITGFSIGYQVGYFEGDRDVPLSVNILHYKLIV